MNEKEDVNPQDAMSEKDADMMRIDDDTDAESISEGDKLTQSMVERISTLMKEKGLELEDLMKDHETLTRITDDINIVYNGMAAFLNSRWQGYASSADAIHDFRDRMLKSLRNEEQVIYDKYGIGKDDILWFHEAFNKLSGKR